MVVLAAAPCRTHQTQCLLRQECLRAESSERIPPEKEEKRRTRHRVEAGEAEATGDRAMRVPGPLLYTPPYYGGVP